MTWRVILASVLIAALAASSALAAEDQGVDLSAMQGWDIVLSRDASPSEVYAAEEFQSHFCVLPLEWRGQAIIVLADIVVGSLGFLLGSGDRKYAQSMGLIPRLHVPRFRLPRSETVVNHVYVMWAVTEHPRLCDYSVQ